MTEGFTLIQIWKETVICDFIYRAHNGSVEHCKEREKFAANIHNFAKMNMLITSVNVSKPRDGNPNFAHFTCFILKNVFHHSE